ncbi:hypothetical protein [Streptomyces sp. R44]|uniref:Uncharacterized protein n=1 Tax=Streptomyces sp. R44 TaxID=3238633 RepID=A0AB39T789_9ACTN
MPKRTATPEVSTQPLIELRMGGVHLTVQRVPGWLISLITMVGGAAGVSLWSQR